MCVFICKYCYTHRAAPHYIYKIICIYWYTHRAVPHIYKPYAYTIIPIEQHLTQPIREASSCCRWELTPETHNWTMGGQQETLEHSALKGMDVFIKSFTSGLRELCRTVGGKTLRVRVDRWLQGNCLSDPIWLIHRWSHRDCSIRHKTCTGWNQMGSHYWEAEVDIRSHCQPRSCLQVIPGVKEKNQFSLKECPWVY